MIELIIFLYVLCAADEEIKREYVAKFQRAFNQTSDWKPSPDVGAAVCSN